MRKSIYILFLFSCSSLKNVTHNDNKVILSQENLCKLDGEYELFANDTSVVSLDRALTLNKYWWGDFNEKKQYRLLIKTIDKNHIETTVFKNDKLIASKTSKLKIENGSLILKKNRVSPFYFIINVWGSMTTRLILLDNGNLMVDHDNFQVATLIIIPLTGDSEYCCGLVFKRLPEDTK